MQKASAPPKTWSRLVALALATAIVCATNPPVHAQFATSQTRSVPQVPTGQDSDDPWNGRELQEKLQRTREKDRQRRIVDDANRLVELTAQYRRQIAAHGKATPEDQKLLADIERLAREVKDRMRGN